MVYPLERGKQSGDSLRGGQVSILSGRSAMIMRLTILFVAFTLAAKAAGQDDAAKKDKEQLQGDWRVVAAFDNGEKVPDNDIKQMKIKFAGNTVAVQEG